MTWLNVSPPIMQNVFLFTFTITFIYIYIFMSINSQFYSFTSLNFGSSRDNFRMKNEKFNAIRWLLIF